MRIIGITGTLGAGKGTVVECLVTRHGFTHYSARAFINEAVTRRGRPLNRDTQTQTANELRAEHGPGYIIQSLFERAVRQGHDAVIESIRTPGELDALRASEAFSLWAIDADPRIRYERIVMRASETDHVSFEKFLADEAREMTNRDPAKQNIAEVMARADYRLTNNGSREALEHAVDATLLAMSQPPHPRQTPPR